jgi:hypothetical protein
MWLPGRLGRRSRREVQTEGLPGSMEEVAAPARPYTPSTLAARPMRGPGHHGIEESACGLRTASNTATSSLAALSV